MIPIFKGYQASDWLSQLSRESAAADEDVVQSVKEIIGSVAWDGDEALRSLAQQFGDEVTEQFELTPEEIRTAVSRVDGDTRTILETAFQRIQAFGQAIMAGIHPVSIDYEGFSVGLNYRPVQRVGCYVPGGRYPLPSTALMTAVTARVAGVKDVCIISPSLPDSVVYAGHLAGVTQFYRMGGAQAVAALAYGTQSIQPVDMVVGPGNAFVTEAKRQLQGRIGIDMLAGPSEVAIIADSGANPDWVAKDMLAQIEHDPQARAFLLTDSQELAEAVSKSVSALIPVSDLPYFVGESVFSSAILVLENLNECVDGVNLLAPEHLQLHVRNPEYLTPMIENFGAMFIGDRATVPFGDYMAGPNHTLPTGRTARYTGGLTPLTFLRPQSWVKVDGQAEKLAEDTAKFARMEGLMAHALAAGARLS